MFGYWKYFVSNHQGCCVNFATVKSNNKDALWKLVILCEFHGKLFGASAQPDTHNKTIICASHPCFWIHFWCRLIFSSVEGLNFVKSFAEISVSACCKVYDIGMLFDEN